MLRIPITGQAQRVTDTVERAMNILRDRKDPANKPEDALFEGQGIQAKTTSARSRFRPYR
jgi:hypothetical protein